MSGSKSNKIKKTIKKKNKTSINKVKILDADHERLLALGKRTWEKFGKLVGSEEPITATECIDLFDNLLTHERLVSRRWCERAVSLWEILEEISNRDKSRNRIEDCHTLFAKRNDEGQIEWTAFPNPAIPFVVPRAK